MQLCEKKSGKNPPEKPAGLIAYKKKDYAATPKSERYQPRPTVTTIR